jgi:hypothetical protein
MKTAMRTGTCLFASIGLWLACAFNAAAQEPALSKSNSPYDVDTGVVALNLAANADQAWKLINGMQTLSPQSRHPEVKTRAIAADMCREFVTRYPGDGRVNRAKKLRYDYLIRTIELGNTNRIAEFEDLFHPDRVAEFSALCPRKDLDLARMRAFRAYPVGHAAVRAEWEKNLRLIKPWMPEVWYELLLLAEQSDPENARRLAEELIQIAASKPIKVRAMTLLEKYAPVGQPIDLKAATLDGPELNLEQWKGKVVLLHFWTPKASHVSKSDPDWSGLAAAKAVYEKFHDRGMEVLSINLARTEQLARAPLPGGTIPWPQYWASTNLSTELRAVAGMAPNHITLGVTTFALMDRNTTLRDRDVPRPELTERIEKLLH